MKVSKIFSPELLDTYVQSYLFISSDNCVCVLVVLVGGVGREEGGRGGAKIHIHQHHSHHKSLVLHLRLDFTLYGAVVVLEEEKCHMKFFKEG